MGLYLKLWSIKLEFSIDSGGRDLHKLFSLLLRCCLWWVIESNHCCLLWCLLDGLLLWHPWESAATDPSMVSVSPCMYIISTRDVPVLAHGTLIRQGLFSLTLFQLFFFCVFSSVASTPIYLQRIPFGMEWSLIFCMKKLRNIPIGLWLRAAGVCSIPQLDLQCEGCQPSGGKMVVQLLCLLI